MLKKNNIWMRHNFLWNSLLCEPWSGIVIHIFPFNYLPFLTVGMTSAPPLFFLPLMAHILSRSRERTPPGFCGTWRRNWWLDRSEECGRFCQSFTRVSRMKSKNSSLHNESSRKLRIKRIKARPPSMDISIGQFPVGQISITFVRD